jgi:hypothetical protein
MPAKEAMKGEQRSLYFKPSSGLIPCDPVTHNSKESMVVTIRPNICCKTDFSGRFLKISEVVFKKKKNFKLFLLQGHSSG